MMKPSLDPRLLTAADFFPYCDHGADIGADHGHLSCYLLSMGKCKEMQVTDISEYSVEKARTLLKRHQLDDRAMFLCGDGLNALDHPAEAIAVCGMGGKTVADILENGKDKLFKADLILAPQKEQETVRRTLCRLDYHITKERIIWASDRFYTLMKAEYGNEPLDDRTCFLGPCFMKCTEPLYEKYILWRMKVVSKEKKKNSHQQFCWLEEELNRVRKTNHSGGSTGSYQSDGTL